MVTRRMNRDPPSFTRSLMIFLVRAFLHASGVSNYGVNGEIQETGSWDVLTFPILPANYEDHCEDKTCRKFRNNSVCYSTAEESFVRGYAVSHTWALPEDSPPSVFAGIDFQNLSSRKQTVEVAVASYSEWCALKFKISAEFGDENNILAMRSFNFISMEGIWLVVGGFVVITSFLTWVLSLTTNTSQNISDLASQQIELGLTTPSPASGRFGRIFLFAGICSVSGLLIFFVNFAHRKWRGNN